MLDSLEPHADGVRHLVLDLRGLTFMDSAGLHELLRQNEFARRNAHNLAVVRGTDAIQRVLELSGVEHLLVLVDVPDDLAPPPFEGWKHRRLVTDRPRRTLIAARALAERRRAKPKRRTLARARCLAHAHVRDVTGARSGIVLAVITAT